MHATVEKQMPVTIAQEFILFGDCCNQLDVLGFDLDAAGAEDALQSEVDVAFCARQ